MATPIDPAKLRTIGLLRGGRSATQVREGRNKNGSRYKATTDAAGHTVTEQADGTVDLTLRPATISVGSDVATPAGYPPCRCGDHSLGDHPARTHLR